MENKFYVYFHINPLKNEVFYVGKGFGNRAYRKYGRNKYWKNTFNKYGFIVDIIENGLTEQEAISKEIFYIEKIGRKIKDEGTLVNITIGGEVVSGMKHIEDTRNKISESKKATIPWNKGLIGYGKGRKVSDETREKMRNWKRNTENYKGFNKKHTQETIDKIRAKKLGKKVPNYPKNRKSRLKNDNI